jgi:hypothetical protein
MGLRMTSENFHMHDNMKLFFPQPGALGWPSLWFLFPLFLVRSVSVPYRDMDGTTYLRRPACTASPLRNSPPPSSMLDPSARVLDLICGTRFSQVNDWSFRHLAQYPKHPKAHSEHTSQPLLQNPHRIKTQSKRYAELGTYIHLHPWKTT